MHVRLSELRKFIRSQLGEANWTLGPSGALRTSSNFGEKTKDYRVGHVEGDENKEITAFEANTSFPGKPADAWCEIVPYLFPDFPFDDPVAIKRNSLFFKIGDTLTVAFKDAPTVELASWNPQKEDWIEADYK
jgi:hypothetical protein